jgi:hypothetical protein
MPASSQCSAEPTAQDALPSAWAAISVGRTGLFAVGAALLWVFIGWGIFGAVCPAAPVDLDAPITATWSGVGLREWAGRVGHTAGIPVLVDRRLDPDTVIRLECRDEPLHEVIARAAAVAGGEVATLDSSIRIVPSGMASLVSRAEAARTARLASLPLRQRSVLDTPMPWQWAAGARPSDLVAAAATKAGVAIEDVAIVPHDHLPAMSLPELTLAEGLDLLLCSFDMRVDWQAAPASARVPAGRIIAIDAGLPPPTAIAKLVKPTTGKSAAGKPPGRRPGPRPKGPATEHTYSLQVAAPLEELLAAIATRLGLSLDLDRESLTRRGIAPGELVRATVKDASRDELLAAILGPLDLTWTIKGDTLRVFAPANP